MKLLLIAFFFPFFMSGNSTWLTDFDQAKTLSKEKQAYILLNFSGSDWCIGCIRLHKEIFDAPAFQQYAADYLILLNADFPRLKKNSIAPDLQKKNEALAEKYNPEGYFPFTVLLDSNGSVIKAWNGYYEKGTESFINELKGADANSSH